jgi:hypothetical protein
MLVGLMLALQQAADVLGVSKQAVHTWQGQRISSRKEI